MATGLFFFFFPSDFRWNFEFFRFYYGFIFPYALSDEERVELLLTRHIMCQQLLRRGVDPRVENQSILCGMGTMESAADSTHAAHPSVKMPTGADRRRRVSINHIKIGKIL